MSFDRLGYKLNFIQKQSSKDDSLHLTTHIYKFHSPKTRYNYILRAEYHTEDVFAIKFYCKKDKTSRFKYSKVINKGDVSNILISCATVVPLLLKEYPTASFGFIGSRTVDEKKRVEDLPNNQRFRIYEMVIERTIGPQTFQHFIYPTISAYLLVNRKCDDVNAKERAIINMFSETYENVPDLPADEE